MTLDCLNIQQFLEKCDPEKALLEQFFEAYVVDSKWSRLYPSKSLKGQVTEYSRPYCGISRNELVELDILIEKVDSFSLKSEALRGKLSEKLGKFQTELSEAKKKYETAPSLEDHSSFPTLANLEGLADESMKAEEERVAKEKEEELKRIQRVIEDSPIAKEQTKDCRIASLFKTAFRGCFFSADSLKKMVELYSRTGFL